MDAASSPSEHRDGAPTRTPTHETVDVAYEAPGQYLLRVPEDRPEGPLPALFLIHGRGQPARHLLRFATTVAPGTLLVAPHGPSTFYRPPARDGAAPRPAHAWITSRDRALEDARNASLLDAVYESVRARFELDPARTFVLAYSQGVGVGLHWLMGRPDAAPGLVGLVGGLAEAYRGRLSVLAGRPVLWVTGALDPAYPIPYTDSLLEAFRAAGIEPHAVRLNAGHDVLDPAREPVASWLGRQGFPS